MKNNSESSKSQKQNHAVDFVFGFFQNILESIPEIYHGIRTGVMPLRRMLFVSILCGAVFFLRLDHMLLGYIGKPQFFVVGHWRTVLATFFMWFWYFAWGYGRSRERLQVLSRLQKSFTNAGLKSQSQEYPNFIFDRDVDGMTRRLRLKNPGLTLKEYQDSTESLQANLGVSIIKIENPAEAGTSQVDIIYTHQPIPTENLLTTVGAYSDYSFPIGLNRYEHLTTSLREVSHLLVAGATNTGKSTYLRTVATVLAYNNNGIELYFLDPKAVEAQIFSGLTNVHVKTKMEECVSALMTVSQAIDDRKAHLEANKARDIDAYNRMESGKRVESKAIRNKARMNRLVVVVDEATEFMKSHGGIPQARLNEARAAMNKIARMGRSHGVHIIVGIQNPDSKNVDTTLKLNLNGKLCFPVNGHVASTIVLGNRRAADLPHVQGRAIWQFGRDQQEVQTPFITENDSEKIISDLISQERIESE
ncbi:MAG: hypothetical protein JNM24_04730 [Bdellovibrionaceae bacterium]|nr:hypothetical protein [Pseudobdellovibrionaceae bacterium]